MKWVSAVRVIALGLVDLALMAAFIAALWHLVGPERLHFASMPDLVLVMIFSVFVMTYDNHMAKRCGE